MYIHLLLAVLASRPRHLKCCLAIDIDNNAQVVDLMAGSPTPPLPTLGPNTIQTSWRQWRLGGGPWEEGFGRQRGRGRRQDGRDRQSLSSLVLDSWVDDGNILEVSRVLVSRKFWEAVFSKRPIIDRTAVADQAEEAVVTQLRSALSMVHTVAEQAFRDAGLEALTRRAAGRPRPEMVHVLMLILDWQGRRLKAATCCFFMLVVFLRVASDPTAQHLLVIDMSSSVIVIIPLPPLRSATATSARVRGPAMVLQTP
ncbi:hypothetical protein Ct61P_15418 [Colletotrichum tofieldiae]|nr:hypothetical protein Ct61P_15418 [Colletotrichum tofieldiae]